MVWEEEGTPGFLRFYGSVFLILLHLLVILNKVKDLLLLSK